MHKYLLKTLFTLTITLFSFNSFSIAIPACDTSECVDDFKKYKKYSKLGYAEAMSTLGDLYFNGHGTDKNIKKALKSYKKGAKYGSLKGQFRAATIYLNNEEFRDIDKGVNYLEKAARAQHAQAAFLLGVIFYKEDFHERDLEASDKWLTKAYLAKSKKAADFIHFIDESNNLTADNYPKLAKALINKPLPKKVVKVAKKKKKQAVEHSNGVKMEVITITANLHDMFTAQIASLKNSYPQQGATNTGSRIIGNTCERNLSCSVANKGDFNRLLSNIMGDSAVAKFY